jgi:hypothetical protein
MKKKSCSLLSPDCFLSKVSTVDWMKKATALELSRPKMVPFNYSITNQIFTVSTGSVGITLNYSFPQSNKVVLSDDTDISLRLTIQS